MILGYVEQPSPRAGGGLVLRVSTDAERWQARLRRVTGDRAVVGMTEWFTGVEAGLRLPFQDWGEPNRGLDGVVRPGWPGYEVRVPHDWRPGIYVADLLEDGRGDATAPAVHEVDSRSARALFVVRARDGAAPRPILYKLPLFTYHAYNLVVPEPYDPVTERGQWCLYNLPRPEDVPVEFPSTVNVHRPGGGT